MVLKPAILTSEGVFDGKVVRGDLGLAVGRGPVEAHGLGLGGGGGGRSGGKSPVCGECGNDRLKSGSINASDGRYGSGGSGSIRAGVSPILRAIRAVAHFVGADAGEPGARSVSSGTLVVLELTADGELFALANVLRVRVRGGTEDDDGEVVDGLKVRTFLQGSRRDVATDSETEGDASGIALGLGEVLWVGSDATDEGDTIDIHDSNSSCARYELFFLREIALSNQLSKFEQTLS